MKKIAIFASGSGTNAENIVRYFKERGTAAVDLILSNRADAKVLERAARLGVDSAVFDRVGFYETGRVNDMLKSRGIDYIVLAGFLWLVPPDIIKEYGGRIVNVHPALLPRHGGKGMYGDRVHRAVVESGDTESGITIHRVNEVYDSGDVIAQFRVPVTPEDTPESVAAKVHELEYRHFPETIEKDVCGL